MWSAGNNNFIVYLGTRQLLVCRKGVTELAVRIEDHEEALQALEAHLANLPGRKVLRIYLSGSLCRAQRVAAVPGLNGRALQHQAATAIAVRRAGWEMPSAARCVSAAPDGSSVVAVLDPAFEKALDAFAARAKSRLASVKPLWAEVLRSAPDADADVDVLVALQDCDSVTVVTGNATQVTRIEAYAPLESAERADAALARALFSTNEEVKLRRVLRLAPQASVPFAADCGLPFGAHLEEVQ